MANPVFILGAGFNADVAAETEDLKCRYPLTGDTLQLCFRLNRLPEGKSIEDLFQEASEKNDVSSVRTLLV